MKICYMDTETTGLYANQHGIVSLAVIIEIDGQVKESREFKMNPVGRQVTQEALDCNGFTLDQIATFPDWRLVKGELDLMLAKYVNRYQKKDNFIVAGYNVEFDVKFMKNWFETCGDNFFHSVFYSKMYIDPFQLVSWLKLAGIPLPESLTLSSMYRHFLGKELVGAHDAMADIQATRELIQHILKLIRP